MAAAGTRTATASCLSAGAAVARSGRLEGCARHSHSSASGIASVAGRGRIAYAPPPASVINSRPISCSRRNSSRKRCDTALEAGARLGLDQAEQRGRVVETMLAEARRLFASGTETKETQAVLNLLDRVFAVQTPCPEASFWQGLCLIRQQQIEPAMAALNGDARAGRQAISRCGVLSRLAAVSPGQSAGESALSRRGQSRRCQLPVRDVSDGHFAGGGGRR